LFITTIITLAENIFYGSLSFFFFPCRLYEVSNFSIPLSGIFPSGSRSCDSGLGPSAELFLPPLFLQDAFFGRPEGPLLALSVISSSCLSSFDFLFMAVWRTLSEIDSESSPPSPMGALTAPPFSQFFGGPEASLGGVSLVSHGFCVH